MQSHSALRGSFAVQLGIMAKETAFREGQAPGAAEVRLKRWQRTNRLVQFEAAREIALKGRHPAWIGILKTFDELEQGEIGIAPANPGQPRPLLQRGLKVAQI